MENILVYIVLTGLTFTSFSSGKFCDYTYSCPKVKYIQERYTTGCGFLWVNRCSRYRQKLTSFVGTCVSKRCCPGYTGSSCSDINECLQNNGGCSHTCVNVPGTYSCGCDGGLAMSSDRKTCKDKNECLVNNGGCSQTCINTYKSYHCECKSGYNLGSDNKTCQDIDECVQHNGGCSDNCVNLPGTYKCDCTNGLELSSDGRTCQDKDECSVNNGGCSQICINEYKSFHCDCGNGYNLRLDGKTCQDIDECSVGSARCSQTCNNTIGTYKCGCYSGYSLAQDGISCTDIDDCVNVHCENGGTCFNGRGTYICKCSPGYEGHLCEKDINECLQLNGGCSPEETCINLNGTHECKCINGSNADGSCLGQGSSVGEKRSLFQVYKIPRKQLPKGCALLEVFSCTGNGRNRSIYLSSTSDWFQLATNRSISYSYGVVFVELGEIAIPISISGLEIIQTKTGIQLNIGASTYQKNSGSLVSRKRDKDCFFFPISPKDVFNMLDSFLPTVFQSLYKILPNWIRFHKSGTNMLSITDVKTELMYGREVNRFSECDGSPIFPNHLYNVFRFQSGFKISLFENDLHIPDSLAGKKFCFLVDFCQDRAETIFLMLPKGISAILGQFDVFKALKVSTGFQLSPRALGLSLPKDIQVPSAQFDTQFWNGYRSFTYKPFSKANVWLDVDFQWSLSAMSIFNITIDGNADMFIDSPSLSTLLTGIFVDEWNILFKVKKMSIIPRLKFKILKQDVDIHIRDHATATIDAYISVGGKVPNQHCDSSSVPKGAFVSMHVSLNPFREIPIIKNWIFDYNVGVQAFFIPNIDQQKTQNFTIDIFTDIVDLSKVIKDFGKVLIDFLKRIERTMTKAIQLAFRDLQDVTYSLVTLIENIIGKKLSLSEVATHLKDIWNTYTDQFVETGKTVLGLLEFDGSILAANITEFLNNETEIIRTNFKRIMSNVRNQVFGLVQNYNGFGFKFSADVKLIKLGFGKADIEFVYNAHGLEHCDKFEKAAGFMKNETTARVAAHLRFGRRYGYFIKIEAGGAISLALSISRFKFVAHFSSYITALGLKKIAECLITENKLVIYIEDNIWDVFFARIQFSAEVKNNWEDLIFNVRGELAVKRSKREVDWIRNENDFGGSYLDGIQLLTKKATDAANKRFDAAKNALTSAQQGISKAKNKITETQTRIWNARFAFDKAVGKMNEAKNTLEKAKTPFRNAIEKLRRAQRRVDNVCRIRTCNSLCVPGFKIKWCKVGWFGYPCFRRTNCMFRVPNVLCHIANAGCRVIRGVAYVALEAAKLFVRVPMLALDAAKVAVSLAQIVVDKSKGLLLLANGALEIAKFGLDTANGVLEVAKYGLDAVKFVVGAALHVFDLIVQYGLKSLLDVRNCGFELQLSTSDKSFFDVSCELKAFLLGWHKFKFEFDFKHPVLSMMRIAKSTVDTLFEMIKDVIGKRKRRDLSFQAMTTLHHIVQLYKRDTLKANESFPFHNFAEENSTFIEDTEIYMKAIYRNRTEYFAFNCDSFLKVYGFLTEAVDTLQAMSNESALNINIIEEYKLTLQENVTFFNFTPEAIGINTEYALNDFNMTSDDIQTALLNFSISPEAFMIAQMTNVSEDTVNILDSQLNEVQTISLMNHWILAMANTTKDYFDKSECSGFKDCVMLGFSMLHDLFTDDLIPSIDISRNTTSHLEDIFMELLSNDSWSIVESNDRSFAIARELRKLNESNMWCSVAPSARAGTTSNNGLYGASLYLWCLTSGSPVPEIRWYLNNTLIKDANGTELRIKDLDHNNIGLYRCEAQNIVANATSEDVDVQVSECHPGSFFEFDQCIQCTKGSFQSEENQLECIPCDNGYSTKSIGASSAADCIDVDECSEGLHTCEHQCHNTNGSYICSCNDGYRLLNDKKSCLQVESSITVKVAAGTVSGIAIVLIIAFFIYKLNVKKTSKVSTLPTRKKSDAVKNIRLNHKIGILVDTSHSPHRKN